MVAGLGMMFENRGRVSRGGSKVTRSAPSDTVSQKAAVVTLSVVAERSNRTKPEN